MWKLTSQPLVPPARIVKLEDYVDQRAAGVSIADSDPEIRIQRPRRMLAQRIMFYLFGGVAALAFLLALAASMNPPDSAVQSGQSPNPLSIFEGVWNGDLVARTITGERVATDRARIEFLTPSVDRQICSVTRAEADGVVSNEVWVMEVAEGGVLKARSSSHIIMPPYQGRIDNGEVFWASRVDGVTHLRRYRIIGNELAFEDTFIPAGDVPFVMTGTLRRESTPRSQ